MAEIINLKEALLKIGPENQKKRHHALVSYTFCELCDILGFNPFQKIENNVQNGDLAIIKGDKNEEF